MLKSTVGFRTNSDLLIKYEMTIYELSINSLDASEFFFPITKQEEFLIKGDKGCKDKDRNRNHTEHGCETKRKIEWESKCRYNKPDENIQNLQDT